MNKADSILNSFKRRKEFDDKHNELSSENIAKENLFHQTVQTELISGISKYLKAILTILVVALVLNVLAVGIYVWVVFID
ncbi:hypothetical protein [Maribacter aestuarii]|uniref:hypothetical protein n=1 Tax=Maribacter aestuarii TaxID=1130723 RepID=UPI00248C2B11|nr:hypothetical protein [Maribacter aestuarii]